MPGFLRVNRRRVHDALLWLKQNNPIYHHIIISVDRLNELPLDDIPQEICSLMKHSDDFLQFADENDGYVPCYVTAGTFARRGLSSTAKTLRSLSGV